MPAGCTALDLAFQIHTFLGNPAWALFNPELVTT